MDDLQLKQRIGELFDEIVDLPPEAQADVLDQKCVDDAVRRGVERLIEAWNDLQARERAGAPSSFPLPLSASLVMMPTSPAAAAAGGGSTGGTGTSDTTSVVAPSGGSTPARETGETGETEAPRVAAPEPRRCAIDIGAVIGRYRVYERIGQGGMGIVFAARHEDLGHDAVVKVLHHEMTHSDQSVQRFMDEARIAAGIQHPGVVRVFDVGRHESGALFILMERLDGEPLQRRLRRSGKLPPRVAIGFALQTARALAAVHAKRVVHRDLKPDNLYLVKDPEVPGGERVKILDFGIAKLHSRSSELTQNNMAMGTPPYMAPEQCMGAARVDRRADLYSLGVLLFEMLCGRLPFRCQNFGEYIYAHTQKAPPPVQRFAQVSPALAGVVARLLAKRPEERFPSAGAFVKELERVPEILGGWEPGDLSQRKTDEVPGPGSGGVHGSHGTRPGTLHGLRRMPSSQAPTIRGQPGARPSVHGWTPGRPHADTAPEASDTAGALSVAFRSTQPEPVDEPAATSPVVIDEVAPTLPANHASWPAAPGSKVDTLGSAPGEAVQPAHGNPARRSRLAATLRWVYGLVPAGGAATLAVAVSLGFLSSVLKDPPVHPGQPEQLGQPNTSIVETIRDLWAEPRPPSGPGPVIIATPPAAEAIDPAVLGLLELFDGGNAPVQRELIDAIRDAGASAAAEVLYRALAAGAQDVRVAASQALCALRWPDAAPKLRTAMNDAGGSQRTRRAADLLCLEDREAIAALEEALDDDAMTQLIAAEALARAGKREQALPVLERALAGAETGSEPWLRAMRGLLWLDEAKARAALRRELGRPEPARALAAAEILAGAGDRDALAYLDRVLADPAFTHRAEAALVLARYLDDSEAARFADRLVAFAQAALGSRHPHERRAAAAVMGRLAGHGDYLDMAALEALQPRLEALRNDSSPDPEERAVRVTARVALLAVYRALSARNHHE